MKKNDHWLTRCTDPDTYDPTTRKYLLWKVWLKGGEAAVLKANARLPKPIKESTLFKDWFWQWPKWRELGRGA